MSPREEVLKRPSHSWAESPIGWHAVGSLCTGGWDELSAREAHVSPERGSFPADRRETGLFSVNSATVQKQSSSSLGRNLTGLAGSWCRSTQKARSHSQSLSSPSASRKNNLKYPLKNSAPSTHPLPNTKRRKSSQSGEWHCGGDGQSPCPAHRTHPLPLTTLLLEGHV